MIVRTVCPRIRVHQYSSHCTQLSRNAMPKVNKLRHAYLPLFLLFAFTLKVDYTRDVSYQTESDIKEIILNETRNKIRSELENYDFNYSGVRKLEDLVMEAGGQPLRTVIVSSWRCGSSFLGDLLNAMPGTFYTYEPLIYYDCQRFREPRAATKAIGAIKMFLKCNYANITSFFTNRISKILAFNRQLKKHCKTKKIEKQCFVDPDLTVRFCKLFPFQLMKIVRVNLLLVEELIQAKELNLKAILLVRDPRAVMVSRLLPFCRICPECIQVERLCADMVSDYQAASRLLRLYPEQLKVLRYEDLMMNLNMTTRELLKFQRLREMPEIEEFLLTHTNATHGDSLSTYRDIKEGQIFQWKNILKFDQIQYIQVKCRDAMKLWGYQVAHNATHMESEEFNPLGVSTPFN